MTFPQTPGFKGNAETGRQNAAAFAPKLARRQAEAFHALSSLGIGSAEEVAAVTGRHWYLTRPRLSELSAMGLVTDSGKRGRGALGGTVMRYRIATAEERRAFAEAKLAEAGDHA